MILFASTYFFSFIATGQYRPNDVALVGGQKSGEMFLGAFKAQQGVIGAHYIAGNHWEHSHVDSFRIAIFRDSSLLFSYHNKDNVWDPALIMRFKDLKTGDRVLIYDIWATWPGLSRLFLQPLEYTLK